MVVTGNPRVVFKRLANKSVYRRVNRRGTHHAFIQYADRSPVDALVRQKFRTN